MIKIEPDKEIAIERAETARSKVDVVVYSDTSGHYSYLGAVAIGFNNSSPEITESLQIQVGQID